MVWFRPLPWDYGVRNLLRRPSRSLLTLAALATVVFLVLLVLAFVRGLDASLARSGDSLVVLVHALGSSENIENSTVPGRTADLLSASLAAIDRRFGQPCTSPELYLGSEVTIGQSPVALMGLVRGVTPAVTLVRRQFQLLEGHWPQADEVLVGRLAATKLGVAVQSLSVGQTVVLESREWKVAGTFAAQGAAFESEIWCPLADLQAATKRQDLSLVAVKLASAQGLGDIEEFCKERLDLELQATPELEYYDSLQRHFGPVRTVAWLVAGLVAAAGAFAGLNTMFGAVVGRVRELAMLQTIGFARRAIALSIVQEALLLSVAASLIASASAMALLNGTAMRFSMGAFALRVDGATLMMGMLAGLSIGILGAIPPSLRALRMPIVDGLKAV